MRWRADPGDHAAVRDARLGLLDWLVDQGVSGEDSLLVASELLANAVVAARDSVVMTAQVVGDRVVLEVADDGDGDARLHARGHVLPDNDSEDGRGLFLVRSMSDNVVIMSTAEGTVIRCEIPVRRLTPPQRGAAPVRVAGGEP